MMEELDGEEWEWESTHFSEVCMGCEHLEDILGRTCKAFPDGIPREIWMGKNPHTSPYPGDHGIQFTERKE